MNSTLLIFFFLLYFLGFFGFSPLSWFVTNTNGIIIFILMAVFSKHPKYESNFSRIVILLYVFIFLNLFSCVYFREQSFYQCIRYSYLGFYIYTGYFIFRRINFSIPKVERALFYLTILFVICYLFQFLNPYYPLFISNEVAEGQFYSEDQQRFRLYGQAIVSLGLFMGLNKYLCTKKLRHIILAAASLLCILLMGFRSLTLAAIISIFILIYKIYGINRRFIISSFGIGLLFVIFYNTSWGKNVISAMESRQETQTLNNEDYIRMVSLNYHYTDFFHNTVEMILGSGEPASPRGNFKGSQYAKEIAVLQSQGFIYQDWGIIGYSWIRGIGTILCIIICCFIGFFLKVNARFYYLGIWLFFLLIGSITTAELFRPGAAFLVMFVLAILDKLNGIYERKNEISVGVS